MERTAQLTAELEAEEQAVMCGNSEEAGDIVEGARGGAGVAGGETEVAGRGHRGCRRMRSSRVSWVPTTSFCGY